MKSWKSVEEIEDFYTLLENSASKPQIIFKDSTTCGISAHAKYRLENGFEHIEGKADFNYLDLLTYRPISNLIAKELQVGKVVYTSSHHAIDPAVIARHLS
jgi:bacillithiol system protein YtxJ